MNRLRHALGEYLELRRALGYRLLRSGKALERFVDFAEQQGASAITTDLALRWARQPKGANSTTWADRLGHVRRFARYCFTLDPSTQIPPEGLIPPDRRRREPYVWTQKEVRALLVAAQQIRSPLGLRAQTYEALFGLIAAAGLRISEALHLDNGDVDWTSSVLLIRNTKFGKTRCVPVHTSTLAVLRRYVGRRDRTLPDRDPTAFFVTEHGSRLSEGAARQVFSRLRKTLPRHAPSKHPPRIHDLRHTFAVNTLRRWYQAGRDVDATLPRVATYLGHTHVNDTYWYLSAVPDLLVVAAGRLERKAGRNVP